MGCFFICFAFHWVFFVKIQSNHRKHYSEKDVSFSSKKHFKTIQNLHFEGPQIPEMLAEDHGKMK